VLDKIVKYAQTLAFVAAATVLRLALAPWLGTGFPFLTYYAALPFAALIGGLAPGLIATAAASVLAMVLFMGGLHSTGDVVGLAFFVIAGSAFAFTGERLQQAYARRRLAEGELREALALRDEFLSIAAHELRTPLTAMILQIESALRSEREDQRKPKLERARRQAGRLTKLVDELLTVGRITSGRLELVREPLDLAELVRDVVGRLRDSATQHGSTLTCDVPATVTGSWDRMRVEQIIGNLVDNAIKYGGGKPVAVTLTADAERATITVRDQGIGIGPEKLGRVFDRFERAVSARNYGGLGLGLYIASQIVDAHGGTIAVASTPGHGATFTVTLPRA
jgi:two-component system, OmpR family, sensor kinase